MVHDTRGTSILDDLELARALTYDASGWGDYQWAIKLLADKSLASKVLPAVDAPDRVAYMRFVPEVASPSQVFSAYPAPATFLTLVQLADGTWRVWGLGAGIPAAADILGDPEFVPGGGTPLVAEWLTRIAEPHPPVDIIWGSLDEPLQRAMAQSWLLIVGRGTPEDLQRDDQADQLAAVKSTHPDFGQFYQWLVEHYRHVYRTIQGKPCLVSVSEAVGVDLELLVFASEEYVGNYEAGTRIPAHAFITRHLGGGEWVIAANARRLPVPGWPPTEQILPGLAIDD